MPPQRHRMHPCYRCSGYGILPLWKLEYIEMFCNTKGITMRSVKTSYFNKLLLIKKFRSCGCVGKSLAGHWLIMSNVPHQLWARLLLPAILACVVYYIYLRSPEKGHLIQNTSNAPTRAQKGVIIYDNWWKKCLLECISKYNMRASGKTSYMFQNFITWAHCEEHSMSVMQGHAIVPFALTYTL